MRFSDFVRIVSNRRISYCFRAIRGDSCGFIANHVESCPEASVTSGFDKFTPNLHPIYTQSTPNLHPIYTQSTRKLWSFEISLSGFAGFHLHSSRFVGFHWVSLVFVGFRLFSMLLVECFFLGFVGFRRIALALILQTPWGF